MNGPAQRPPSTTSDTTLIAESRMQITLDIQTIVGLAALVAMMVRTRLRNSLTPPGTLAAAIVGLVHALHPFRLLVPLLVFFLCGTKLTAWGGDIKAELLSDQQFRTPNRQTPLSQPDHTFENDDKNRKVSKTGRTATQVMCNSLPATILALLHMTFSTSPTFSISHRPSDLLVLGVIAQYACSAADTFSSEIGILNDAWPVLITTLRKVPPGTNGGVSVLGLVAAVMGGGIIGLSAAVVPSVSWVTKLWLFFIAIGAGVLGSLVDSVLGATMQRTVYDTGMKKVIEVHGGASVRTDERHMDTEKYIVLGFDILDNNQVNLVSAIVTIVATTGTVAVCSFVWSIVT